MWNPTKQNFTKVVNMMSLRLKNNLAAFSHALKTIVKNDKKTEVYIQI